MSKEEILVLLEEFFGEIRPHINGHITAMNKFSKAMNGIKDIPDAKEVAIGFAEFLHPDENGNHWQMYDGHDRWINLKTDEVLETKQLYQQYLNQRS